MRKICEKNVLREISAIAFSDFTDYVSLETIGDSGQVLTVTDTRILSRQKRSAVCSIKAGTKGVEVKLYDKLKALELLGRVCGVFSGRDNDREEDMLRGLREILEGGEEKDAE